MGATPDLKVLQSQLELKRWFREKGEAIHSVSLLDVFDLSSYGFQGSLQCVELERTQGKRPVYLWIQSHFQSTQDNFAEPTLHQALLKLASSQGAIIGLRGRKLKGYWKGPRKALDGDSNALKGEQSNSSIFYPSLEIFLKLYRKLEQQSLEREILSSLSLTPTKAPVPQYYGHLTVEGEGETWELGLFTSLVSTQEDGWAQALRDMKNFNAFSLGQSTAHLHLSAAKITEPLHMRAQVLEAPYLLKRIQSIQHWILRVREDLGKNKANWDEKWAENAALLLEKTPKFIENLEGLTHAKAFGGKCIRTHGDYHLGQVLCTSLGFVIIDFEGEPARTPAERQELHSPFKDVAGMLRSFAYAGAVTGDSQFSTQKSEEFLEAYLANISVEKDLIPKENWEKLLDLFVIEKAIYELYYEIHNRPAWINIPLNALIKLI